MKYISIKNNLFKKESLKRCNLIRRIILKISQKVSAVHIGGSFSSIEIIDCVYNLLKKKNDTFILSKGHTGILLYTILYLKKKITKKILYSYCKKGSKLGVHPDYGTYGITASTGSLGHGLAIGAGIAFANRQKNVYVLLSDGELQEGSVWEAALFISSNRLNNIIVIIDFNGLQSSTWSKDTHPTLEPIERKFISFGWDSKTCNGHSTIDIYKIIQKHNFKKPLAIVAKTIKGYPISFMKNNPVWHYKSPNNIEFLSALKELNNYEK